MLFSETTFGKIICAVAENEHNIGALQQDFGDHNDFPNLILLLLRQEPTGGSHNIWHLPFINMSTCEVRQVQQPATSPSTLRCERSETSPTLRAT